MRQRLPLLSLTTLPLFLCQCGSSPEEETEKQEAPATIVGRVSSVSSNRQIVLIEKYNTGNLPEGQIYHTANPEGNTGHIHPTGERIRNFHAADLVSGNPAVGDTVIMRRISNEPDPQTTPSTTPTTPAADPSTPATEEPAATAPQPTEPEKPTEPSEQPEPHQPST